MTDVFMGLLNLAVLLLVLRVVIVIERTVRAPGGVLPPIEPIFRRRSKDMKFTKRQPDNLMDLDQVEPEERKRAMEEYLKGQGK